MDTKRGLIFLSRFKTFILTALLVFASNSFASIRQEEAFRIAALVHEAMTPLLRATNSTVRFESIELDSGFNIHVRPKNYPNTFTIYSSAGVSDHKNMSREIYALLVCHEYGHVLGGLPTVGYKFIDPALTEMQRQNRAKLSVEGQADFFATHVCLPAVLADEARRQEILGVSSGWADIAVCNSAHRNEAEREVCAISVTIAEKTVQLLSRLDPNESAMPRLGQTNVGILPEHTLESYPSFQCRLATFLSGALVAGHILDSAAEPRPACWLARDKQKEHGLFQAEMASYEIQNSIGLMPSFLRKRNNH